METICGYAPKDFDNKCNESAFIINGMPLYFKRLTYMGDDLGHEWFEHSEYSEEALSFEDFSFNYVNLAGSMRDETMSFEDVHDFSFAPPKLGYVQYNEAPYWVTRIAERNWTLGLSGRNLSFASPCDEEIRQFSLQRPGTFEMLQKIFVPELPMPFDMAMRLIEEGSMLGVVLSPEFAVCSSFYYTKPVIFYKNIGVGEVEGGKVVWFSDTMDYIVDLFPDTRGIR
jgi:hypothetical protein